VDIISNFASKASKLPTDIEVDESVLDTLRTLVEQYPDVVGQETVAVAERVLRNESTDAWDRRRAIRAMETVIESSSGAEIPTELLYQSLADPSRRPRKSAANVLATLSETSESLSSNEAIAQALADQWKPQRDDSDTSTPDPLVTVATADPETAADLGRTLVSQTTTRWDKTVELLQQMAEIAPEEIEPVLSDAEQNSSD
jgi:hypothetical protein